MTAGQMYKVFINDNPLVIMGKGAVTGLPGNAKIMDGDSAPNVLAYMIDFLENHDVLPVSVLTSNNTSELFRILLGNFKVIKAAGGLVSAVDEAGPLLFICRYQRWDLPKGKLDHEETDEKAAIREVEEECGVTGLKVLYELPATWHSYIHHGRRMMKHTAWYRMTCPALQNLKPQYEEGITEVRWVEQKEIALYLERSYGSIRDVVTAAMKRRK